MVWACMFLSGVGSLIFIDDITHDGSSLMNSEVYKNILSANLETRRNASKLIGRNFIMKQDNAPKHTAGTIKDLIWMMKWNVLDWPSQSPDLNPIEHTYLLKRRLKGKPPKQTTEGDCSKSLEKPHRRRCNSWMIMISMGHKLYVFITEDIKCYLLPFT